MNCPNCGYYCEENADFCPNCGAAMNANYAAAEQAAPQPEKKDSMPLVTLILGIVAMAGAICCCGGGGPVAIAGLIIGIINLKKYKEMGIKDTKLTVGTVLCGVAIVLAIIFGIVGFVVGFIGGMAETAYYY